MPEKPDEDADSMLRYAQQLLKQQLERERRDAWEFCECAAWPLDDIRKLGAEGWRVAYVIDVAVTMKSIEGDGPEAIVRYVEKIEKRAVLTRRVRP